MKFIYLLLFLLTNTCLAQDWTSCSAIPAPGRDDGIAFQVNGFGYVVTGNQGGFDESNVIWKYDLNQNSWTQAGTFPGQARQYSVALTSGKYAYIIGGSSSTNTLLVDCWRFDGTTESWEKMADFTGKPRWAAAGFTSDTALYISCGSAIIGTLKDTWRYSLNENQWYEVDSLPGAARRDPVTLSVLDKRLIGTGYCTQTKRYLNDFYEFDLKRERWTLAPTPPFSPRSYVTAVGPVLAGGIDSNNVFRNEAFYFDYQGNWLELGKLPISGVKGMCAFQHNEAFYFGTGLSQDIQRLSSFYSILLPSFKSFIEETMVFPNPSCKGAKVKGIPKTVLQIHSATGQYISEVTLNEFGWSDLPAINQGIYYISFPNDPKKESIKWVQTNCY